MRISLENYYVKLKVVPWRAWIDSLGMAPGGHRLRCEENVMLYRSGCQGMEIENEKEKEGGLGLTLFTVLVNSLSKVTYFPRNSLPESVLFSH